MILKSVSEETGARTAPPHAPPLTSLPVVQTVYDLKGRSLQEEAKVLHSITSKHVYMENLQQGALAWEE